MSLFSKVRGGFSKLVSGHKENSSPKAPAATADIKARRASKPAMSEPAMSKPAALHSPVPRSVTTSATPEAVKTQQVSQLVVGKPAATVIPARVDGAYDRSGTPEAYQKNLDTLESLLEKRIPIFEQFFGYKMTNEEFLFLGENNFHVFFEDHHYSSEQRYPVEIPAMNALITLLQNQPKINKLDFTVVKDNIAYISLPTLFRAVATGKVPYVAKLIFKGHQITEFGKEFFDVVKKFANTGKVKIQIDSGAGMKQNIKEINFSDL